MKRFRKMALAMLLAALLVCGTVTPAFSWTLPMCPLISPDNVHWFDLRCMLQGLWMHQPENTVMTLYSKDGLVWYTQEGLAYYEDAELPADDNWETVSSAELNVLRSPDGGKMWMEFANYLSWTRWTSLWPQSAGMSPDMPTTLYTDENTFVLRTEPYDGYTQAVSIFDLGVYDSAESGASDVNFAICSDPFMGDTVLLSMNGYDWTTQLTESDWENNGNGVNYCYSRWICPIISFNPYTQTVYHGSVDGQTGCVRISGDPLIQNSASDVVCRNLYLRALYDCTVSLHLGCDAPDYVYGAMMLNGIVDPGTAAAGWTTDPTGRGQMIAIVNGRSQPYVPLDLPQGSSVSGYDSNNNWIIDRSDAVNGQDPLAAYTVQPARETEVVVHLLQDTVYAIPFFFWAEGQNMRACGSLPERDSWFNLDIRRAQADGEQTVFPISYTEENDGVTVTYVDPEIRNANYTGATFDPSLEGLSIGMIDSGRYSLQLPQSIGGKPVIRIADHALYAVSAEVSAADPYVVQNVILPNTVRQIGRRIVGDAARLVHVPYSAAVCIDSFGAQNPDLVICCDARGSAAEQILSDRFTFDLCTVHGLSHTHTCGAWTYADENTHVGTCTLCDAAAVAMHDYDAVVTAPTCTADGYTTYTCVCGDTYTADATDALGHDFGAWVVTTPATFEAAGEETRTCTVCGFAQTREVPALQPAELALTAPAEPVYTGDTFDVTVDLTQNPGIVGLNLKLSYDPDALELTDVQKAGLLESGSATLGGDYAAVPYTVLWVDALTHDNYTDTGTILTFTFTVKDTATPGTTTVTLLTSRYTAIDVSTHAVPVTVGDASLMLRKHTPGDSDGDGEVDLKDVVDLSRYIVGGWDVTVDMRNADVDGDGELTLRDVVLLRRYLAGGWNVTLV